MNESNLVSEIEHLSEQLGKELDSRTYLEEQLKEVEGILASTAKAYKNYKQKYYGGKHHD